MNAAITGRVRTGSGRASMLHTPERLAARSAAAGLDLVPGTLNVELLDGGVQHALQALAFGGAHPVRIYEPWCRIGPGLDVYPVWLRVDGLLDDIPAVVTRSENSRSAQALEVMAVVRIRDLGVVDGTPVELRSRLGAAP